MCADIVKQEVTWARTARNGIRLRKGFGGESDPRREEISGSRLAADNDSAPMPTKLL